MPPIQIIPGKAGNLHQHQPTSTSIFEREYPDPAKTLVMTHVGQLVSRGLAEWRLLDNDEIELRLPNGEIFLLGTNLITRIN